MVATFYGEEIPEKKNLILAKTLSVWVLCLL